MENKSNKVHSNENTKKKDVIEFKKMIQKKEKEYQRLINNLPKLKTSSKSEIKKWYKDFVDLLFR
jgi:spore coat protein CotH